MSDHDELERLRRAFTLRSFETEDEVVPRPTAEELWAVASGEGTEAQARRVAEAIAASPTAAMEWRATRELVDLARAQPATVEPAANGPSSDRSSRWTWTVAVAAAAVLAVVLQPPPGESVGGQGEAGGLRAPDDRALTPTPAVGTRVREPLVLAWEGHPPDSRFDLVVLDASLRVLVDVVSLDAPRFEVPSEALERRSGARVYWRVTTIEPDGRRSQSPTFWIELAPRADAPSPRIEDPPG